MLNKKDTIIWWNQSLKFIQFRNAIRSAIIENIVKLFVKQFLLI